MSKTRERFPLSPKKIFKKTIEGALAYIILLFLVIGLPLAVALIGFDSPSGQGDLFNVAVITVAIVSPFLVIFTVYRYQRWHFVTYFYDLTPDHIVIRKGPITPREIIIPYGQIQDVGVNQSVDDRIFGLYNVYISSATVASGSAAYIEGLEKDGAEGLRAIFLDKIKQRIGKESVGVYPQLLKNGLEK